MARRTDGDMTGGGVAVLDRAPDGGARPPSAASTRTAGRTVAALIGLNVVIQIGVVAVVVAQHLDRATAIKISLLTGVVFYGAAALATRVWSRGLDLETHLGTRGAVAGAAEGIVVGAGAAVLLSALLRLVLGRPSLDPTSAALAAGGAAWLVLGVVVVALVAPVVEELVFRGFLLEAFRGRGRHSAVVISAVAFSLAHLRLAQLRYYFVMGLAFALVYLRRGLVGSIAAHAAFNGVLLLVAAAALHGPAQDVSTAGFTVTLPAAWTTTTRVVGDDLVASGPLGTRVELTHLDAPRALDVDLVARDLSRGALSLPHDLSIVTTSVTVVNLPAGRAVRMDARIDGHGGQVVMVPKGNRLWVATLRSATGDRSARQFDDILRSWRLP